MDDKTELFKRAVKVDGNLLKYGSYFIKSDEEIVKNALRQNPQAIQYVSVFLRDLPAVKAAANETHVTSTDPLDVDASEKIKEIKKNMDAVEAERQPLMAEAEAERKREADVQKEKYDKAKADKAESERLTRAAIASSFSFLGSQPSTYVPQPTSTGTPLNSTSGFNQGFGRYRGGRTRRKRRRKTKLKRTRVVRKVKR